MGHRCRRVTALLALAFSLAIPQAMGQAPPAGSGTLDFVGYVRVIDGDTLDLRVNGRRIGVGLIGIRAPAGNTVCGRLAADALAELVTGGVILEEDSRLTFDARWRRLYRARTRGGASIAEALAEQGLVRPDGQGAEASAIAAAAARAAEARRGCAGGGE